MAPCEHLSFDFVAPPEHFLYSSMFPCTGTLIPTPERACGPPVAQTDAAGRAWTAAGIGRVSGRMRRSPRPGRFGLLSLAFLERLRQWRGAPIAPAVRDCGLASWAYEEEAAQCTHTHNHASRMFMWPIQGTGIASYTHIAAQKKDIGSLLHKHLSRFSRSFSRPRLSTLTA